MFLARFFVVADEERPLEEAVAMQIKDIVRLTRVIVDSRDNENVVTRATFELTTKMPVHDILNVHAQMMQVAAQLKWRCFCFFDLL